MHIIIVGGGRMGSLLADKMSREKHDVVVIDSDPKVCEDLADLNATIINGDVIELETLEKAGIEKTDVVAALTSKDETNLMVCLMAKNIKNCKVASRVSHKQYEEIFKRFGIDIVIFPESAAADYLEQLITRPDVADLASIDRGDAVILEFLIKPGSKFIGKEVKLIDCPKDSKIIALSENSKTVIPEAKTTIKEGIKVFVISRNEVISKVRKMFE